MENLPLGLNYHAEMTFAQKGGLSNYEVNTPYTYTTGVQLISVIGPEDGDVACRDHPWHIFVCWILIMEETGRFHGLPTRR